jgi:hypothetical protein
MHQQPHAAQGIAQGSSGTGGGGGGGYVVPGAAAIPVGVGPTAPVVGSPPNSNWSGGSTSNATLSYTQNNQASASSYCKKLFLFIIIIFCCCLRYVHDSIQC